MKKLNFPCRLKIAFKAGECLSLSEYVEYFRVENVKIFCG